MLRCLINKEKQRWTEEERRLHKTLKMEMEKQAFLLGRNLKYSVGNIACKSPLSTGKVESGDYLLCQLPLQLLQKDDSDKVRMGREKDLGGVWAGGKDQNIHIDGKSPPQALG